MIILFWLLMALLALVVWGVADSVIYRRNLKKSLRSPDDNHAITQLYGFHVKYSNMVEPGTVLFVRGTSIWDPDFVVFSSEGKEHPWDWEGEWQEILDREED